MTFMLNRRQFLGTALAGTAATTFPFGADAQSVGDIKLAFGSDGYTWSVPYVADGIDSWKKFGLNSSRATFPSGRESLEAAITGDMDLGTTTDSPYLFAALRGLQPMVFANYSRYSKDMKVVMRNDRGASVKDPASIKGKKIATHVGTSGHYMLSRYMAFGGLKKGDVTIVNMNPGDAINATVRGDVDGFCWTSRAFYVAEKAAGQDKLSIMTQDGLEKFFQSHQLLCVSKATIAKKPQIMKPAMQALLEAEAFIKRDKSWAEIVAKRTRTEAASVVAETDDYEFQIRVDERFVEDLIVAAEWAFTEGLAKKPEKPLRQIFVETFYTAPLAELAPDRVKVTASS